MKWEYLTVYLDNDTDINGFGVECWELVSVVNVPELRGRSFYYFKRQITE